MATKTLFARTETSHPYPPYVNATLTDDRLLRITARARPTTEGREGPTACVWLDPDEAVELAEAILKEYRS